jgi:Fuc2NAc and GlcNAc transferase
MSGGSLGILLAAVFAASCAMAWGIRLYGLKHLMDVPNERSSHTVPVPRGGGMAIVAASIGGCTALWGIGAMPWSLYATLAGGGTLVAAIGFVDDHKSLPVHVRIVGHFAAAVIATWLIGPVERLAIGPWSLSIGWIGWPLTVVGLVWMLNLYNFMDGIDGLAGSQAVFACGAGLMLAAAVSARAPWLAVIAAASLGFLVFNWPPARLFMGDGGSGWLGFALGAIALQQQAESPELAWAWLLLLGVFVADATVTLLHRMKRGERWYAAHRQHAYQHAARRYGHAPVTSAALGLNVLLAVLALLAVRMPQAAAGLVALVYVGLCALALRLGAGAPEAPASPANL